MLARTEVSRNWHVLLTQPQMERKAAARLIADRIKVYLPEETIWARRGVRRKKVEQRRPMFRGYLFVKIGTNDEFATARNVNGVHNFLRFGNDLAVVPPAAMERIHQVEQVLLTPSDLRGPSSIFKPGERVRVTEGPFEDFTADIIRLDDEERITVLLNFLGRQTPMKIYAEHVEKL